MTKDDELTYRPVPLGYPKCTHADVRDVKKLDVRLETDIYREFQNRNLVLRVGITCVGSLLDTAVSLARVESQGSIDDAVTGTDAYYRVLTKRGLGAAAAIDGPPQYIQTEFKYWVDQRYIAEKDKPWLTLQEHSSFCPTIWYLSFGAGVKYYNLWRMYKLDFTDLDNVKFEFVKLFSYVQGQIIDHPNT